MKVIYVVEYYKKITVISLGVNCITVTNILVNKTNLFFVISRFIYNDSRLELGQFRRPQNHWVMEHDALT